MKKTYLAFTSIVLMAVISACGNNNDTGTKSSDSTATTTTTTTDTSSSAANANNTPNNTATSTTTTATNNTPFKKDDSTFVMKAAMGGMMEVEGGKIAQQNAQSDRVKGFGSMMVNDHSNANQQLTSLATSKGLTIPTTLPADMQKHLDQMRNMKGKAFDTHYMSMMLADHKKDVSEFEKEASKADDPDLKAWVTKTLPVLKTHLDSAQAISKAHM